MTDRDLSAVCKQVRRDVLDMVSQAGSSHVGGNFSMVELLVVLYYRVMRVRPSEPAWADRDRFVLSKGHACAALYAVLAEKGFFPRDWLRTFYRNGSKLAGHVTHAGVPGVEVSTGSLGHGLSIATGMAYAAQLDDKPYRVYCLLSDGECDEGSTWEPALFAAHHRLSSLTAIVDYNKIQSLGSVSEVLDLHPFADKWRAFGWDVDEIDGHDVAQVEQALVATPAGSERRPRCIIAHTVKGKGVSFMEGKLLWHYRCPQGDELETAIREVDAIS